MADLLELIKERLDPDELIDLLGLETEELVYLLEHIIEDNLDKFEYLGYREDTDVGDF